ncbi:superoxide dismutase [Ancylobacter defluvii]|uniref:Superoxide dismutase n=1 Tax=Ancylobacter defluvii TaxID=1282440 RepID=A0A9W6NBD9_9HYPH|nr:superoxide dismutase [Ancylobacter defluvii]MBS7589007.1 superoxide dismutase [Ancylobacter defluvii]GLK84613.1 superoxide dismutase [Ancylobacter defluvii]
MFTRRTLLAAAGAVAATGLAGPHVARAAAPFQQPPLPYGEDALAPTVSARTVGLHYGKHHKAYFDKLNKLVEGKPYADMELEEVIRRAKADNATPVFNNAGQAWNHNFYWQQFKGGPAAPPAALVEAATRDFGGIDPLKAKMVETADGVFGTGWVWLVADNEKLQVLGLQDAGNPIAEGKAPLLGIDVWEHAYYLDWENRRTAHVKALLDERVNWAFVGERLAG